MMAFETESKEVQGTARSKGRSLADAMRLPDRGWVQAPLAEAGALAPIQRRERIQRRALACADLLAAGLALVLCVELLGNDHLKPVALLVLPLVVLVSKAHGLYDRDEHVVRKTTLDEAPSLFQLATLYALVVTIFQRGLVAPGPLGADQILILWVTLFVSALGGRLLARAWARRAVDGERLFVLGDADVAERLALKLADVGTTVVGHALIEHASSDTASLRRTALELDAHRLVIAPSETAHNHQTLDLIRAAKATGLRVSLLPNLHEVVGSAVTFDDLGGIKLLGVKRYDLSRSSSIMKRTFDIAGASVALLIAAPVLIAAAIAIKLDTPGPVFFRQERVGRGGRRFKMLKFRSMVDGADAMKDALRDRNEADGLFKIADDPRITRVGRLLRKSCLDEVPQLLNVLRGEMSLVGPRPLVADEDVQVTGWYRRRLRLTPGMTGPWQVLGSARVPFREMVKIDYLYVAEWSLWNDMKILLRTVPVLALRRGQ
jgi:exopolysaccharide biosynthesis polyprenyl glycosylphosphotransferase